MEFEQWTCLAFLLYMLLATSSSVQSTGVMHSIPLQWNFDNGLNGWARSTAMEMGLEIEYINGFMRGVILSSARMSKAFVDSPELRVDVDPNERDYLVIRMKYLGQCERAMVALERNSDDMMIGPELRRERRTFHDPIMIPFHPIIDSKNDEIYVFPLWKHVTGTINRLRVYPCTVIPTAATLEDAVPWSGQTFQIDWIAFAKAPVIVKVRGCIDKYYTPGNNVAKMNCTEHVQNTNGMHRTSAFECFSMVLPIATTYNCLREGGQRITISGKHFGQSDAIVTVDGLECTNVVHTVPEVELQCTLPSVSSSWIANPKFPSVVRVYNGRLQQLFDEVSSLSYVARISALPAPILSNVAAHSFDVNWLPPSDIWISMTVTGYKVEWKKCVDNAFNSANVIVVGNVTSTTVIGLDPAIAYQVRVTPLAEDYQARTTWQNVDLYGQRPIMLGAVGGFPSSFSSCLTTLSTDFQFQGFTAQSLTNVSSTTIPLTIPTIGPTGEIGDQGHFGLYVNGHANIQNSNATITCCDNYDTSTADPTIASNSCTFVSSVTESRSDTHSNGAPRRSIPTNALSAIPFPAKSIRAFSTLSTAALTQIAPISAKCGPALRLTPSAPFRIGSAWYPRQMNVREGFETNFVFQISNPSTFCKIMDDVHTKCRSRGGDGFAFVIQNDNQIALGAGGMEIGYGGLRNALAVEFDTYFNSEQSDVYENHVSIHVSERISLSGSQVHRIQSNHAYSLGSTSNIPDLSNSDHTVRIRYDPNLDENILFGEYFTASTLVGDFFNSGDWISGVGILSVFLDQTNTPILAVPVRLESAIALNHGRAWVGFTAATGETAYQTHDILSWSYRSLRRNVVSTPAGHNYQTT